LFSEEIEDLLPSNIKWEYGSDSMSVVKEAAWVSKGEVAGGFQYVMRIWGSNGNNDAAQATWSNLDQLRIRVENPDNANELIGSKGIYKVSLNRKMPGSSRFTTASRRNGNIVDQTESTTEVDLTFTVQVSKLTINDFRFAVTDAQGAASTCLGPIITAGEAILSGKTGPAFDVALDERKQFYKNNGIDLIFSVDDPHNLVLTIPPACINYAPLSVTVNSGYYYSFTGDMSETNMVQLASDNNPPTITASGIGTRSNKTGNIRFYSNKEGTVHYSTVYANEECPSAQSIVADNSRVKPLVNTGNPATPINTMDVDIEIDGPEARKVCLVGVSKLGVAATVPVPIIIQQAYKFTIESENTDKGTVDSESLNGYYSMNSNIPINTVLKIPDEYALSYWSTEYNNGQFMDARLPSTIFVMPDSDAYILAHFTNAIKIKKVQDQFSVLNPFHFLIFLFHFLNS
jgi:hypothetical protein